MKQSKIDIPNHFFMPVCYYQAITEQI